MRDSYELILGTANSECHATTQIEKKAGDDGGKTMFTLGSSETPMSDNIVATVYAALGRQLKVEADKIREQADTGLDELGLDSHGLMRVLLDIERDLQLSSSLELPDDALESPRTLADGVVQEVGGG